MICLRNWPNLHCLNSARIDGDNFFLKLRGPTVGYLPVQNAYLHCWTWSCSWRGACNETTRCSSYSLLLWK